MSIWESLRNRINPVTEKRAEFQPKVLSKELVAMYIKTAESLDVTYDEAVKQLKTLEDARSIKG